MEDVASILTIATPEGFDRTLASLPLEYRALIKSQVEGCKVVGFSEESVFNAVFATIVQIASALSRRERVRNG